MYRVQVKPYYHLNQTNPRREHFLRVSELPEDHQDFDYNCFDIMEFENEDDAQGVIDELNDGIYHLSNGEYQRPDYSIMGDGDGWGDDCCYSGESLKDEWEEIDPSLLPDGVQDELDRLNVEFCSAGDNYDIYTAELDIDGDLYAIAFCPKHIALDGCSDDLGGLNWDHQTYYRQLEYIHIFDDYGFNPDYMSEKEWIKLSDNSLPEGFIRKYADKLKWDFLSQSQDFSEEFIREFIDKVDWWGISAEQVPNLSEDFLFEYREELYWETVFKRHTLSDQFVIRIFDYLTTTDFDMYYLFSREYISKETKDMLAR